MRHRGCCLSWGGFGPHCLRAGGEPLPGRAIHDILGPHPFCPFRVGRALKQYCSYGSIFMAKRSRSKSSRTHHHASRQSGGPSQTEMDLFELLIEVEEPFLLVLDGVQDPHNLGACLRSANAAGVHAVISPRHRAVPITDTVRTVACGAAEVRPFMQVTNLAHTLRDLRDRDIRIVGTTDAAKKTIYDVSLKGPLVVVMGAEGKGARRLTLECCDEVVNIPMFGSVECLNVSVATGVCLFEAVRQRRLVSPAR